MKRLNFILIPVLIFLSLPYICLSDENSTALSHPTCTGPDSAGSIKGKNNVCFGDVDTFSVPIIGFATGYNWILPLGAKIVSGVNTNTIVVLFTGTDGNITVEGTNSCSTGVASSFFVKVNPIPKATIIIDNPSGCVPLMVNFILQNITNADSSIAKFLWTFGESNEATTKNATHTYIKSDSYKVNLKITSEFGCDSTFGPISINAFPIPEADFIPSPNNKAMASYPHYKFKDKSKIDELILKSKIVKYEWDFGDLNLDKDTSSKRSPEYNYTNDTGTYYVTLIIETNHGCRDTVTKSVVVIPDMPFAYVLYPNPNKGFFSVEINKHGDYMFKLFSIEGKLVFERSMVGYEIEIINQKLAGGNYLVSIQDALGNVIYKKMIVE